MADLTYPYLVEGVPFNAASLNTRFGGVAGATAGLNALMDYAAKRGAFQEVHLPATGIVAGEQFTANGFTTSLTMPYPYPGPTLDRFTTTTYTGFGDDVDRQVLSDSSGAELKVMFDSGITLGMGNAQKIGGLLILVNVHFLRVTLIQDDTELKGPKPGKVAFMICLQYTTDNGASWNTVAKTERFQSERIIDNLCGEGPFSRQGHNPFRDVDNPSGQWDTWTFQDMSIRTWFDATNFTTGGVDGFRVVGTVVNLDPAAMPPASSTFRGYYRDANLSVVPWHAEALP